MRFFSSADLYGVLIGILLAVGTGLFLNAVLTFVFSFNKVIRRRGRLLQADAWRGAAETATSEDELLGLDSIPWSLLYVISGAVGSGLALLLPVFPTFRIALAMAPAGVYLLHKYMVSRRRKQIVVEVRQLLIDIRMLLTLRGSLLLALQSLAEVEPGGIVMRNLARAFKGGRPHHGLEVLEGMSQSLKSPQLGQAVQRLRAAAGGALDLDEALATAIKDMSEDMNARAEEKTDQMPTRITFIAVPFLLGPIIIILLYPIANLIIQTLTGAYAGGGSGIGLP